MTQKEFSEFVKSNYPVKIEIGEYGEMTILFDNGISVEVDSENDYDSTSLTFESSVEKEAERAEFDIKNKERNEASTILINKKLEIRKKFTDEQWAEIELAFIDCPQLTSEQWQLKVNAENKWMQQMYAKYGDNGSFKSALEILGK